MPQLIVKDHSGDEKIISCEPGWSVMEAIRDAGMDGILALCGGVCSCATCHVYVDASFLNSLPPMSNDEDELLDSASNRRENSRLSCQIRMNDALSGLRVTIAENE